MPRRLLARASLVGLTTASGIDDDYRLLVQRLGSFAPVPDSRARWGAKMEKGLARNLCILFPPMVGLHHSDRIAQKVKTALGNFLPNNTNHLARHRQSQVETPRGVTELEDNKGLNATVIVEEKSLE